MSATDGVFQALQQAAEEVFALFAQAVAHDRAGRLREAERARNQGGRLLHGRFGRWFERHYTRLGLDEAAAQDLAQDAFIRVYTQVHGHGVRGNAFALLCAVRRTTFLDHLKRLHADKRSAGEARAGTAEVLLDDEAWETLLTTTAADDTASPDLQDCVQRKLQQFQAAAPARAEVLEMLCFGLSAREIAAVVYAKPEDAISAQEAANVRDRIYHTRHQARTLFAECEEGA